MYIKIYFNDKPLFLCNEINTVIAPYKENKHAIYFEELTRYNIEATLHKMEQPETHAGIFLQKDMLALKEAFWKKFTIVQAAGGLVQNKKKETLLIFRRGKWDLPKGKLDPGETLTDCAIREVEEETGLKKIKLQKDLLTTYHTYHEKDTLVLKQSFWYEMSISNDQVLVPQTSEDIQQAIWADEQKVNECLQNAFASVVDVISHHRQV